MLIRMWCIAALAAWTNVGLQAATAPPPPDMKLVVDKNTGEAWLVDYKGMFSTHVLTGPVDIDGYTITSTGGYLVPMLSWNSVTKTVTNGWFSIADAYSKENALTATTLGADVAGFGRLNPTVTQISEANVGGWATFIADTTLPLDTPWYIGKPVQPGMASLSDLKFTYHTTTGSVNQLTGVIEIIPEPATCLLVLPGVWMLHGRRRSWR